MSEKIYQCKLDDKYVIITVNESFYKDGLTHTVNDIIIPLDEVPNVEEMLSIEIDTDNEIVKVFDEEKFHSILSEEIDAI